MGRIEALARAFGRASDVYAARNGVARGDDWYVLKLSEELGELVQIWMKLTGRGRTNGKDDGELRKSLEDETADLFGHVLLFAERNGLDLASAVERKWLFDPEESMKSDERVG